jgi:hypothetical protein
MVHVQLARAIGSIPAVTCSMVVESQFPLRPLNVHQKEIASVAGELHALAW